jgi:threonine aldolase
VLDAAYTDAVADLPHRYGLALHLDGARVFNAAVALGVDVKELVRGVDSLSVCLSKGLAAPVGSVICGTQGFVREARRTRKILGGGMRQAGVIAAAGIVAMDRMVERIQDDHDNAARLARGLAAFAELQIDPDSVQTNLVYFRVTGSGLRADRLVETLDAAGVRMLTLGPDCVRAVTHYGIEAGDIDTALEIIGRVLHAG